MTTADSLFEAIRPALRDRFGAVSPRDAMTVTEALDVGLAGSGIGSESIPGQEFPERTIYTDESTGNMYFVPFVADDGRVGYRIGFAVKADGPDGDRASVEAFVYLNPSTSVSPGVAPDVFVYAGINGTPDQDEPVVFVVLDDETLGIAR